MSAHSGRTGIQSHRDLQEYLLADLSPTGLDLLVIGKEVRTGGRLVDLLAINSAGVIYIIELKWDLAASDTITQILGYRRSIKQLDRERIIRLVADGQLKTALVGAFQRHFGHPLPETVNESQVLMVIAGSVQRETATTILELLDEGLSITTFRHGVRGDSVNLIPCCRNDQDVAEGFHLRTEPSHPSIASLLYRRDHRSAGHPLTREPGGSG
ncbi:hypothetical protein [Arthrobacter sp. CAN_C5]|uniref:hypothetical protein n=1 Tax=Arthrobacter sp. CAN_C5 TaxID=2760706 RepID=UPI001AE115BA|nr:hypothetical protein [Arthrobacter sp. CAN_C5]MBP2218021.1 hypothetical protein [Arthrobacter sp. CAN_C5]